MLDLKALLAKELEWIDDDMDIKVLASGAWYMNAQQTITLSENVSDQHHGIILVWSAYSNGAAQNYDWNYTFVPKYHVQNSNSNGNGVSTGVLSNTNFNYVGTKYVYIRNDTIIGNNNNQTTGTASGISWKNNYWVLRYVLGI